ncbi:related to Nucleoporin nup189 (SonB) [Melanopsichium pennsylvanicum]|uniref:Related to Nucleoporin nup189 (SonB) n=2 Tax=Melanopsichium pennsylvanicum TaxID=63383 RepID=A0AAJ4XLG7_9BASI|nr:related to Nucleoporin nup189 (SonB) [Melanopsichium pennsylvanicum 4]SNX84755.1 related to Nucleoporin nup189 (SonB) [Melanopsichium pennsylvanicum]
MFGSSGFGGFGQQNNQQQQQQQPAAGGGLFGQAQQPNTPAQTGFGASSGFGSTGGFGAAQPAAQTGGGLFGQQQNQTQTPSFGGFGASTNNASTGGTFGARPAGTTGFGGFGASAPTAGTNSFTFGSTPSQQQQQPAAGGFGSSTFGSAAPATGGLFGQQQQQQQPAAGGFGATAGAFGQPAAGVTPSQITQGTATVPYDPLREDLNPTEHLKDRKNWDVQQSITVMPAYSHYSLEELRLMDYQQGRSKGNTGPGAAGAPASGFGFGANNATGAFGQPQQQSTGFGATPSTTTGGLFGQAQQQQPGGLFGQQNNTQQLGGMFGAKPATTGFGTSTTGGGLFGQQQNQPQTGGLFGQQQQQQQPTSSFSFGAQPQQPAASTGFTFGANNNQQQQQQNKPAFGFGASTSQPGQTGITGFGFGANNNQQQGQTSTGFGAGATGTTGGFSFGAKPATGGLFGGPTSQPGQTAGATSTFGGFGASSLAATQNKPAFGFGAGTGFGGTSGAGTGTTAAPAAAGGLFGNAGSTQPSGGLFSNTNNAATGTAGTGGFSFGASNQQQAGQTGTTGATGGFGGGLFGAKPATGSQQATGGLFSSANTQQGQQVSTGFGAGPSTGGGLFGSTANKPTTGGFSFGGGGGSSLFGGTTTQNNQQHGAGGLGTGFGQTQNTGGGLFGSSNQTSTGVTGGGLFSGASNTGGSSLFGNTSSSNTGGGLFGSSAQNTTAGGLGGAQGQLASGGLFGQSQQNQLQKNQFQNQQQQPTVQLSLESNPYGTDSLFASNPINSAIGSAANGASLPFNVAPKNKPPLTTPFRSSPRGANKINRLRGSTPGASGLGNSSFIREGTPGSFREGTPGALTRFGTPGRAGSPALFKGLSDEYSQPLSSQAFVSRPSAKRLVLDDAGENSFTASRIGRSGSVPHFDSGSSPAVGSLGASAFRSGSAQPGSASRVTFSPALEQRAESVRPGGGDMSFASSLPSRRGNFLGTSSPSVVEETPLKTVSAAVAKAGVPRQGRDLESSFAAPSTTFTSAATNGSSGKAGEYYTEPSLSALCTANYNELAAVHNFIVGRKGVGQIEFLEPVDLTSFGDLNDIIGGIVQIRLKEVVVYPEEDDYDPRNPKDGAKRNFVPGIKAKQGTGLNVPARVSLEACWPTDRATREPIKDAENPRIKQMINKLKNKPETEFIDFEPESGTWTFKVKHFSRYGLDDSDEDEATAGGTGVGGKQAAAAEQSTAQRPASKRLAPMTAASDVSDEDASIPGGAHHDRGSSSEDDDDAPPPLRTLDDGDMDTDDDASQAAAIAAAKQRQRRQWTPSSNATGRERAGSATPSRAMSVVGNVAEARRVQVMQASFFGQDDSEVASAAVVTPRPTGASLSATTQLNIKPTSASPATIKPVTGLSPAVAPVQEDRKIVETRPREPKVQEVPQPAKKLRKINVAKSDVKAADGETLDAGLSLGRSFRVGWGPDGSLVHNGRIVGASLEPSSKAAKAEAEATASTSTSTLVMEKIKLFKDAETSKEEAERAEKLLSVQLQHTDIEMDEDGVPAAYTDFSTRFRHFASSFEHKDRSFEASLWRLGVALFDEIDLHIPEGAPAATAERFRNMRRKAALSDWLRHTVAGTVETEARSHIAASRRAALLFSYLSGNQVERAVNAALDAGDLRLATLIAQAGGDEEVRADISEQLLTWRKEGVDAHIARDHRRVYELLSGNVLVSQGTDSRTTKDPIDQVNDLAICEGLDWKRAFGLFLWYESPYEAPLEHSFERYEAQISPSASSHTGIAPPLPWYRESSSLGATRLRQLLQKAGGYDRDALFELLKLYVDPTFGLESALDACSFGQSKIDARLPWHLYNLLSRVLQRRDFSDRIELGFQNDDMDESDKPKMSGNSARADTLCSSYAHQLELIGKWRWSAFILLHLELGESREAAVKALLSRNVAHLDSAKEFLCDQLRIPESWLYEAKSYEARARDDRYEEYQLLLKAKNFTSAHNVASRYLAPEAVIRGDHELVSVLFSPFFLEVEGDPQNEIAGWADGAALYIDYVAASREIPILDTMLADPETRLMALDKAERFASRLPTLTAGINALLSMLTISSSCFGAEANKGERTHMVARTEMIAGITNLSRMLINIATATSTIGLEPDIKARLEAMGAKLLSSNAISGGDGGGKGLRERSGEGNWDSASLEVWAVQDSASDYLGSLMAVA